MQAISEHQMAHKLVLEANDVKTNDTKLKLTAVFCDIALYVLDVSETFHPNVQTYSIILETMHMMCLRFIEESSDLHAAINS